MTLQDTLTFETLEPEEVLKRATKFKHSKLTTKAFQKANAATAAGTRSSYNLGVKIKQEPVMSVRNSKGNTEEKTLQEWKQ